MSTRIQRYSGLPNALWTIATAITFSLLAAATPIFVVLMLRIAHPADSFYEQSPSSTTISVGIPTGLMIGFLIGLRRGRLRDLFLGPAIGWAIGYADFKLFEFLMKHDIPISIANAAMIPIWGACMGIWAGTSHRKIWQILGTIFLVTAADYIARMDWSWPTFANEQWPFLLSAAYAYLPPSLMAVALTARRSPSRSNAQPATAFEPIEHSRCDRDACDPE